MNNSPQKPRSLRSFSSELIYTIPFSLIAAHLFVGFRQKENYLQLFLIPEYWPAFLVSAGIAFLLILHIKYASRYVYLKPDISKTDKLALQVIFGFLLAIVLEFGFSTAYFACAGYHISDTVYFDSYLLPIVMYILLINLWYTDGFHFSEQIGAVVIADPDPAVQDIPEVELETAETELPEIEKVAVKPKDIAAFAAAEEVGMITPLGSLWVARSFGNKGRPWFHNLTLSMKYLPDSYFQVTRNYIIHEKIIHIVDYNMDEGRVFIHLKSEFDQIIEVEKQYIYGFYEWWKLKKPKEN